MSITDTASHNGDWIKLPKIGLVKAVFDRRYVGKIKTVTVTKDSSDKYFASVVYELEACFISGNGDKIIGLDLGILDFCIAHDGSKTSKYANPRHFKKHEKNLARKQQKLARKQKDSKTRQKAKKLVAKVHARISNARQDFLHKLSRKLTQISKVVVVENLSVKGMVRNHKLAQRVRAARRLNDDWGSFASRAISDVGWGMFVNFLSYKLEREDKRLVEIDRFFPSSHICPDCLTPTPKMDLSIREWICLNTSCGKIHDRDEAASRNIRAEGIRIIKTDGTAVSASGGSVRQDRGRKTKVMQHPAKLETHVLSKI
ncbi:MAG TPA: RNA-guided endonuclease TnpB family protein [Coleofasciculaceae cyanobacterium]